jgi:hypothetical protein
MRRVAEEPDGIGERPHLGQLFTLLLRSTPVLAAQIGDEPSVEVIPPSMSFGYVDLDRADLSLFFFLRFAAPIQQA